MYRSAASRQSETQIPKASVNLCMEGTNHFISIHKAFKSLHRYNVYPWTTSISLYRAGQLVKPKSDKTFPHRFLNKRIEGTIEKKEHLIFFHAIRNNDYVVRPRTAERAFTDKRPGIRALVSRRGCRTCRSGWGLTNAEHLSTSTRCKLLQTLHVHCHHGSVSAIPKGEIGVFL